MACEERAVAQKDQSPKRYLRCKKRTLILRVPSWMLTLRWDLRVEVADISVAVILAAVWLTLYYFPKF